MSKSVITAEPIHRCVPSCIRSGISFRKLPTSSFEQLRKVASFYQAKANQTSPHPKTKIGRYLHDFSNEVFSLCDEIERQKELEICRLKKKVENYATKLAEYEQCFGCSVDDYVESVTNGEFGIPRDKYVFLSPKQLQQKLKEQDQQITQLKQQLLKEQEDHEQYQHEMTQKLQDIQKEMEKLRADVVQDHEVRVRKELTVYYERILLDHQQTENEWNHKQTRERGLDHNQVSKYPRIRCIQK